MLQKLRFLNDFGEYFCCQLFDDNSYVNKNIFFLFRLVASLIFVFISCSSLRSFWDFAEVSYASVVEYSL